MLETLKTNNAFDVIGIAERTSNAAEFSGKGKIGPLWKRFFDEEILTKIPHKADNAIIALYYDYESNKDGAYTILIGARVTSTQEIPLGMVHCHVPAQKYAVFTTERGIVWQQVVKTWQFIWQFEDESKLNRSYVVDYQLYDQRSMNPNDGVVDIYIGIK